MDLRTFVALELPPELKHAIHEATKPLRDVARTVKWVDAENLHITLKFLGRTPEAQVPAIEEALRRVARGYASCELNFAGVGAFPPGKRPPRVIWVGVKAPESLIRMQADMEQALAALGFEPEPRSFSPHLTLGRVKEPPRGGLLRREMEQLGDRAFGSMHLQEISLMKSTLTPSGAVYDRLCAAPLEA